MSHRYWSSLDQVESNNIPSRIFEVPQTLAFSFLYCCIINFLDKFSWPPWWEYWLRDSWRRFQLGMSKYKLNKIQCSNTLTKLKQSHENSWLSINSKVQVGIFGSFYMDHIWYNLHWIDNHYISFLLVNKDARKNAHLIFFKDRF